VKRVGEGGGETCRRIGVGRVGVKKVGKRVSGLARSNADTPTRGHVSPPPADTPYAHTPTRLSPRRHTLRRHADTFLLPAPTRPTPIRRHVSPPRRHTLRRHADTFLLPPAANIYVARRSPVDYLGNRVGPGRAAFGLSGFPISRQPTRFIIPPL
jgi:hypothetical protein